MLSRFVLLACASVALLAAPASADVLVYPERGRPPGGLGGLVGGAWGAFASGTDALFYNPAGLAAERGSAVSAGGDALTYQDVSAGSGRTEQFDAQPGYLAWAVGPERRGEALPVGWGWFAYWPVHRDLTVSGASSGNVSAETISGAIDTGGLDAFPDGISQRKRSAGRGRISVLATGVSLGLEVSSGWRVGAGVQFERAQFTSESNRLATFDAENESGGVYNASVHEEARIEGRSDRWVPFVGLQARPTVGVALGVVVRLASRGLGGEGSVFYTRSSRATLSSGSGNVTLDDLTGCGNSD